MTKIKKTCPSVRRGSILAYSLIILSMMLAIAASLSTSAILEKKGASATEFSAQSIQTADSGLQIALKKINDKIAAGEGSHKINVIFPNCVDNSPDDNFSDSDYKLTFYDDEACTSQITALDCDDAPIAGSGGIACIRSVGTYKNTVRAASMAVAAKNTALLLHADGNFNDSSQSPKTVTANGNVVLDPMHKFAAGNSMFFSGGYLSIPHSADFDFGSGNMTIDAWVYGSSWSGGLQTIFTKWNQAVGMGDYIFAVSNGRLVFYSGSVNVSAPLVQSSNPVPTTTWVHVAVQKNANVYTLFIDGVPDGTSTNSTPFSDVNISSGVGMYMNAAGTFNVGAFSGYIDELRVSKGIARWPAGDFSASLPTAPYPN